jgi:hypothetical protein
MGVDLISARKRACERCAELDRMMQAALRGRDLSGQVDVRVLRFRHAGECPGTARGAEGR